MKTSYLIAISVIAVSCLNFSCSSDDPKVVDGDQEVVEVVDGDNDTDFVEGSPDDLVGMTCGSISSICNTSGKGWIYCDSATQKYVVRSCVPCLDCCKIGECDDTTGCSEKAASIGWACYPGGYCSKEGACLAPTQWDGLSCDPSTDNQMCMTSKIGSVKYVAKCNEETKKWGVIECGTTCSECAN